MAANHLEQLVAEWYEYQGFFVRRNILVGKRARDGYECELDVVALHPTLGRLVHIEPSMDTLAWAKREVRFARKFEAGRRYIPTLFDGFALPANIEQIALLYESTKRTAVGGGRLMPIGDLLKEIVLGLKGKTVSHCAVPEHMPILRTLQFVAEHERDLREAW